jgi:serine/threonine protein kinase
MNEDIFSPPTPKPAADDEAARRPGQETVDEAPASTSDPAVPAPAEVPAALARHPRYRVLKLLGRGGMGAVYLAEHKVMERAVALKVIRPDLTARPELIERFRREAKAAARLSHPNIVTAHDAEQAGDCHFLVTEYVAGIDLARWLQAHGPLPAAEACSYIRQATLGLQHAHEQGMVHRDLKPHNLMRTPAGQVKILDFGLARLAQAGTEGGTASGAVLGTADYMAPEQANDAHRADIRADIYSLGCTLYELLSGSPPFPGGGLLDKLRRHALEEPMALTHFRPELPEELAAVVGRMLAKDPAARYPTPAEVAAALEPWCQPLSKTAEQPRRPGPGRRWRRRWLAVSAAIATLVLVLGAGLTYLASVLIQPSREPARFVRPGSHKPEGVPPALDLSRLPPLIDDDFSDPKKSCFGPFADADGETRFEQGRYVLRQLWGPLRRPDTAWVLFVSPMHHRQYASEDLACQVRGRLVARHENAWSLLLFANPEERSLAVRFRRDGKIEVGDVFWKNGYSILAGPFESAAVKPSEEFNRLLVAVRGGQTLELFVNGTAVCPPIRLKQPLGKVRPGLQLFKRGPGDDGEMRAEFTRFTQWQLPASDDPMSAIPIKPPPEDHPPKPTQADSAADPSKVPPLTAPERAPDLSKVTPLVDDDFRNPRESGFHNHENPDSTEVFRDELGDMRFENRRIVMRLFTGKGLDKKAGEVRWNWRGLNSQSVANNFAYQLVGRVLSGRDNGWALMLHSDLKDLLAIRLRRDGKVEIGKNIHAAMIAGPFEPPAGRPGKEFNTLLVRVHGSRTLDVYVNGLAVCPRIRLEQPLGRVHPGMMLWKRSFDDGDGEMRAEFARFTLWELPEEQSRTTFSQECLATR